MDDDAKRPHGAIAEMIDMVEDMPVVPTVFVLLLGVAAIIYSLVI